MRCSAYAIFCSIPVKKLGHVLFPLGTIDAGPPVEIGLGLPRQPDLARMLCQQIHFFETFRHRKPAGAITDNHHVIRSLHYGFGEPGHILDLLHRGDASGSDGLDRA